MLISLWLINISVLCKIRPFSCMSPLSPSANKRPGRSIDTANQEYVCGDGGGAGTISSMISPTQYPEWHPGHTPALMQAHIRAPALGGLTGCLLRHSLTFHSTSIPADNSAWLSIVRLYCVIEVQGQAYKSRTPPRLWALFPGASTTIKKIWGGWLPPVTKLTSHSNQTAGE